MERRDPNASIAREARYLAVGIVPVRLLGLVAEGPRRLAFWTGILSLAAVAMGLAP